MAKKKDETDVEVGGQFDLIDVKPAEAEKITSTAKKYKNLQAQRLEMLALEVAEKVKLLELIKQSDLQRLPDGKIKFRSDGFIITVTPRDELINVVEENGD